MAADSHGLTTDCGVTDFGIVNGGRVRVPDIVRKGGGERAGKLSEAYGLKRTGGTSEWMN